MFTVKINDEEYEVIFEYLRNNGIIAVTNCYILSNEGFKHGVGIGHADVHPNETPNKNTGRKIAMKRALMGFYKTARKQFWNAYYEARGGKW